MLAFIFINHFRLFVSGTETNLVSTGSQILTENVDISSFHIKRIVSRNEINFGYFFFFKTSDCSQRFRVYIKSDVSSRDALENEQVLVN